MKTLSDFVRESNMIEGIYRTIRQDEFDAHELSLRLNKITVRNLEDFVEFVEPGAKLRRYPGMNVRVGSHRPPFGGPEIIIALEQILQNIPGSTPYQTHCAYETLHPFMDGNGRSGRMLWLWHMDQIGQLQQALGLGFLHNFYYQALGGSR